MNMTKDSDIAKSLKKLEAHVKNTKRYIEKRREAKKDTFTKGNPSKQWKNLGQKRKV
uniref:Uncharacterized protein n=1 Tax=Candidatus Kentrum sp. SD TaxID=2126332 RepID=A0A450Z525_9GAMM|nr:MAG: hypothetical protein BECKSD772F_GA0070984_11213 [Candidatus Kentron sp. SD]VFK48897.1 MAG: hypothetical protein BECKSD772E_GA0070983_11483 [Candidatus Kentron sp. SD]VFK80412.1 MAG: hypothetical protein BECKSD772D_GA0070982_11123 [Candidatus Kentron sp. SD]